MTTHPDKGHTIRVTLANGKSFTCRRVDILPSVHRDVDICAMLNSLTSDGQVVVKSSHNKPMTISVIRESAEAAAEPESQDGKAVPLQAYHFGIRVTIASDAGEAVIRAASEEEALCHLEEMIRYREGTSIHGQIDLGEAVADLMRQLRFRDRAIGPENLQVLDKVATHSIPALTYEQKETT